MAPKKDTNNKSQADIIADLRAQNKSLQEKLDAVVKKVFVPSLFHPDVPEPHCRVQFLTFLTAKPGAGTIGVRARGGT